MLKLKSKLIVAVMVMFGITAFMSCEKEIEESNKVPDVFISDSDISKLAQKHNEYLTDVIKNYDYESSQDYIADFEKNFINSDLDGLNQDERIQVINNMKIRSSKKSSQSEIEPSTINDLIIELNSSEFENKDMMIEVVNNATSIITKDKSTCSDVNAFLDNLLLEKVNNFNESELIVLKSYFETLKASAYFWYPTEREGSGIGYAHIQKIHGNNKADLGPLGSALVSDAASMSIGMIGVAVAGAFFGPVGWGALAIVAGESAANSGLAAVISAM